MATFTGYVEVLTDQHPQSAAYAAGVLKSPPGLLLRDVLARTEADGNYRMLLGSRFREEIRQTAEVIGDSELMKLADTEAVPLSVRHLLNEDPDTRVVLGHRIDYTPEESELLRTDKPPAFDPRTSFYWEPGA